MFYKNCYIIQSLKQSLKINHYYFSLAMKNWGSKESKLLSQRSYPERARHQAVPLCWLEAEGPASTTRTGCRCHLFQETSFCISHFSLHHSMFFATVSCNLPQRETTYVCRCIYTQKCKHVVKLLLHPAPSSPVLRRQNHVPLTKMTRS